MCRNQVLENAHEVYCSTFFMHARSREHYIGMYIVHLKLVLKTIAMHPDTTQSDHIANILTHIFYNGPLQVGDT